MPKRSTIALPKPTHTVRNTTGGVWDLSEVEHFEDPLGVRMIRGRINNPQYPDYHGDYVTSPAELARPIK